MHYDCPICGEAHRSREAADACCPEGREARARTLAGYMTEAALHDALRHTTGTHREVYARALEIVEAHRVRTVR